MSDEKTGILPAPKPVQPRVRRTRQGKAGVTSAPPPRAAASSSTVRSGVLSPRTTPDEFDGTSPLAGADPDFGVDFEEDLRHPERLTRRSLTKGDERDAFYIPPHLKKPGWDYQWDATKVQNEPVGEHTRAMSWAQGWRPVPAHEMKEILPPGYRRRTIEWGGQMLMMRPMRLSVEAREEMRAKAEEQKLNKMRQAAAVPDEMRGITKRELETFDIVGELGTHRQKDGAGAT